MNEEILLKLSSLVEVTSSKIITYEVAHNLLKIYLRYDENHKCLCTSRFRHALHQLPEDSKVKLASLCEQLYKLMEDFSPVKSEDLAEKFLDKVFDVEELSNHLTSKEYDLEQNLRIILARLISDYRGIFAIEKHYSKAEDETHKLRKRHEEDDDCPEEIKLMKVDLDELSLNCSSASTAATTSMKQKLVTSSNSDKFINRYYDLCRKVSKGGGSEDQEATEPIAWQVDGPTASVSSMETLLTWTNKGNNIRKRKELHDSLKLDSKQYKPDEIGESDVEKSRLNILQELRCKNTTGEDEISEAELDEDDSTTDTSSSSSSPVHGLPQFLKNRRGSLKENLDNEESCPIPASPTWDHDEDPVQDCQSRSYQPPLAWHPHYNVDDDEGRFNRTFGQLDSDMHLDHSHFPKSPRRTPPDTSKKLKQLTRQLNTCRKSLERLEMEFESARGYRPSHADKYNDESIRNLMTERSKLKKRIREIRDDEGASSGFIDDDSGGEDIFGDVMDNNNTSRRDLAAIFEFVKQLTDELNKKREDEGRPQNYEDMNEDQLVDEKVDLYNVLKQIETVQGKLETEEEKEIIKTLSDRYNSVKRMVRRSSTIRSKDSSQQLTTIPEDEEIHLTLASPQHRINIEILQPTDKTLDYSGDSLIPDEGCSGSENPSSDPSELADESSILDSENLHALSRYELIQIYNKMKDEKKHYRRIIRNLEHKIQLETGRKLAKEDRDMSPESVYQLYKNSKYKFRLVEALLSKQKI